MNYAPQFKQMSDTVNNADHVEMFSFDKIAQTVSEAIFMQLLQLGWSRAAATAFLQSKAIRHGLDQSLGMALEQAAEEWTLREAPTWQQHNQNSGA